MLDFHGQNAGNLWASVLAVWQGRHYYSTGEGLAATATSSTIMARSMAMAARTSNLMVFWKAHMMTRVQCNGHFFCGSLFYLVRCVMCDVVLKMAVRVIPVILLSKSSVHGYHQSKTVTSLSVCSIRAHRH